MKTNHLAPHVIAVLIRCETHECDNTGKLTVPGDSRSKTLSFFGKDYDEAKLKLDKFLKVIDNYEENR